MIRRQPLIALAEPVAHTTCDAAHIAVAVVHGVHYLLTWNGKHLANAQISRRIERLCADQGFLMPRICTPEELCEEGNDVE